MIEFNGPSGIVGFVWLVVSLWAIVRTLGSAASTGKKVLWIVIILLLPVAGVIGWFFLGPKQPG